MIEIKFLPVHAIRSFSFSSFELIRNKEFIFIWWILKRRTLCRKPFSLVAVILCAQQKKKTLWFIERGLCLSSETSYGCLTRVFLHGMLLLMLKSNRPFLSYCCLSLLNLGLLTVFVLVYFNSIYFLKKKKDYLFDFFL